MLLGWSGDAVPPIVMVDNKPPDATEAVEAWVRFNDDGSAMQVIYVRTDTDVYREAAQKNYQRWLGSRASWRHERWHLFYGRDEIGAYTAQLSAMDYSMPIRRTCQECVGRCGKSCNRRGSKAFEPCLDDCEGCLEGTS